MDAPQGIFALPANEKDQQPCGGSGILISRDGLAITLSEALPGVHPGEEPGGTAGRHESVTVILSGGRTRQADIVRRGTATTAVLLQIHDLPAELAAPMVLADSSALHIGDTAWTAGNSFGALEQDGLAAISRGLVSGLYAIPADSPPVHGRGGRILSDYRGPIIETDAAVNDGNQGGALLDDAGRVIGLVSLGTARERRLGTAVPIRLVIDDLGLGVELLSPARQADAAAAALAHTAAAVSPSVALVYFERTGGIGNPEAVPRPNRLPAEVPGERERLQGWWDEYYHQQQMFYTDQAVNALVIDAKNGLLLTSFSNLHGDADHGRVLVPGGEAIPCSVLAYHLPLDLALIKAERPLPFPDAVLASSPQLVLGERVGLVARHRADAGYTLTSGMVSATARRLTQSTTSFAQTDAHANYGSLGGVVVDCSSAVVGMMVLLGPDEGRQPWAINSGVALFADSASILRSLPALEQGVSTKSASIVGLGVMFGRQVDGHLIVGRVVPDTGAQAAGIKDNDVLLKVDGDDIISFPMLSRILLKHHEGDQVMVVVRRSGKELSLPVVLRSFLERPE
jgi:S1-C subfamily serine protease